MTCYQWISEGIVLSCQLSPTRGGLPQAIYIYIFDSNILWARQCFLFSDFVFTKQYSILISSLYCLSRKNLGWHTAYFAKELSSNWALKSVLRNLVCVWICSLEADRGDDEIKIAIYIFQILRWNDPTKGWLPREVQPKGTNQNLDEREITCRLYGRDQEGLPGGVRKEKSAVHQCTLSFFPRFLGRDIRGSSSTPKSWQS